MMAILISISKNREAAKRKTRIASALGFKPLEKAPPPLLEGIQRLHPQISSQALSIENIYHRREFEGEYYLFNLDDTSDEDSVWQNGDVIGIISNQLALPRFYLISLPPINEGRWLGRLMDRMLDKVFDWAAAHQELTRVTYPNKYGFDDQYALFVEDENTAQSFFSDQRLNSLTGIKIPFQIIAAGNMMIISRSYPTSTQPKESEMKALFRVSQDLFQLFQEKRMFG